MGTEQNGTKPVMIVDRILQPWENTYYIWMGPEIGKKSVAQTRLLELFKYEMDVVFAARRVPYAGG